MLIDSLELFYIDGYQIFINDMKTVVITEEMSLWAQHI